jgi:hypothetical protein
VEKQSTRGLPGRNEMNRRRKQRLEGEVGVFLKKYNKKRQRGWDPNDRQYNRSVEALVQRMTPEDLDELMNGGNEDEPLLMHRAKRTQH